MYYYYCMFCHKLWFLYAVGSYMLMNSLDAIPGEKAQLKSPSVTHTSGCLDLTFYYYLYGSSKNMEISVHTITTGKLQRFYKKDLSKNCIDCLA